MFEKLNKVTSLFAVVAFVLCLAGVAFGQETTGNIRGTVKDPTGAVVTGATVTATSAQRSYTATTNEGGEYNLNSLPPSNYSVTVSAPGFANVQHDDVPVELGRTLQVNFDLAVAGTTETVNVTASDEPMVDVTSTKTATNISQEKIDLLPKTLRFSSVVEVAPGTRNEVKGGGFQIDGASGSENVWVVDGLEVTRIKEGTLGLTKNIPFDFVREVQVKSAGYEAEFGGATGGVINVVTRSGTNEFHGEARVEFGFDELNASDRSSRRFDRLRAAAPTAPTAAQLAAGVQPRSFVADYFNNNDRKDDYQLINPAFNLGGPIIKNKLWFYTSYAPQFEHTTRNYRLIQLVAPGTTVNGAISPNGAINQLDLRPINYTTKYDYFMTRLDYSPWQSLSLNFTGINSPVKTGGPVSALAFETTSAASFNNIRYPLQGGFTPSNQVSGQANWTVTPNLVISGRIGRTYLNDKGGSYDIPTGPIYSIGAACNFGTSCVPGSTTTGTPGITNNTATLFDKTTRQSYVLDATWTKRILGQQHQIKGGYQLNRLANIVDSGQTGGTIFVYYDQTEPSSGRRGTYGYYNVVNFGTKGQAKSRNQGLYIQDAWQIHPRVTLNLGLRTENEFVPTFPLDPNGHPGLDISHLAVDAQAPIKFGWRDKLAPRIGGAWDVKGDGKIKIYGSYSVFYDTMKYELPRGSFGADIYTETFHALDTLDYRTLSLQSQPGTVLFQRDNRVPSLFLTPGPNGVQVHPVDPNLKPVREHEYTVGTDFALSRDMVLGGRFTRKALDRTIEDIGLPFLGSDGITVNEVFMIGNPGSGTSVTDFEGVGLPGTPKAVREYTGFEVRLDKRFSNNWYGNLVYLRSKLFGNYSGLASSDETGRVSPNVNRYFDLPTIAYDAHGNLSNGLLPTDRPNTFKAFGAYRFNYGFLGKHMETEFGASQYIYQGTPISTFVNILTADEDEALEDYAPSFVNGRGDLGRTPIFTQTDALINHRVSLTEGVSLRFQFNVLNLFNEANVLDRSGALIRTSQAAVSASNEYNRPAGFAFYQGTTYVDAVQGFINHPGNYLDHLTAPLSTIQNPFYNKPTIWQGPRNARFSIGVQF